MRANLSEKGCPIIIGAGVAMAGVSEIKDYVINYKAPFYDFFQNHYLRKLHLNELIEMLLKFSEITHIKISIDTERRTHLQALFQMTGGNPCTVVILFKLLVKGFSESIAYDMEALLDESTPLNKSRFEELPAQQQIILNAIAQNWDPINLSDLSKATRYKYSQLSPQLNRLIAAGWIETTVADKEEWADKTKKSKEKTIKGNAYSISERFLSIWLVMRNGNHKIKNEIRKVLESYKWIYGNNLEEEKEQIKKEVGEHGNKKDYDKAMAIAKNATYPMADKASEIGCTWLRDTHEDILENKKAIGRYDQTLNINHYDEMTYNRRGHSYSEPDKFSNVVADFSKTIETRQDYITSYVNRGWEYTYGDCKDYDKAIADYTKAIELDVKCSARKFLMRLYRDIKNQFGEAETLFAEFDKTDLPKDVYYLEQTLFALHKRNEGIAADYLSEALAEIQGRLSLKTQENWLYFAAITIKIDYAKWLLKIFREKDFDTILYVAIQALAIEKQDAKKGKEFAETYLKNQAMEKSEPARIIIEKMRKYL
jgi:hypothetical protein